MGTQHGRQIYGYWLRARRDSNGLGGDVERTQMLDRLVDPEPRRVVGCNFGLLNQLCGLSQRDFCGVVIRETRDRIARRQQFNAVAEQNLEFSCGSWQHDEHCPTRMQLNPRAPGAGMIEG